jgi:DNA (cytosine-5)-methyltransferase 1
MERLRFVDLFAGLGGFHLGLHALGHRCVFASEIDDELREIYKRNFSKSASVTFGDITANTRGVPPHDVLCAGFPCQPFSKSGFQNGGRDTRGSLFDEVLLVARRHRPTYVLLENVGNFERHDDGRTWRVARASLEALGYSGTLLRSVQAGGSERARAPAAQPFLTA